MHAIHFLRSRQEESELNYWLALVAFNRRDTSLNNRIYLVYLFLFFSVWVFITLTFFASGGAAFLQAIDPANPARVAVLLQVVLLAVWTLFNLWQALRHSPVMFSEQDAVLLSQTPIDRRHVVLRWLPMPWLKSAVPFWLIAITLGFSCAELLLPGGTFAERIVDYSAFGLRTWLAVIPIHLGLYSLQWTAGLFRLQKDVDKRWYGPVVFVTALIFALLLIRFTVVQAVGSPGMLDAAVRFITSPIQAGFGQGSLPAALLGSSLLAAGALILLYRGAGSFNLSRAAQETQELVARAAAIQYGLPGLAQNLQMRKRLGVGKAPTRLPPLRGATSLVWKDIVQSMRSVQLQTVFNWLMLFGLMLSIPFLPDPASRALAAAYWVIQVSKMSVIRLRSDLANWALARQLPIASRDFLLLDLAPTYLLCVIVSLGGLVAYSILSGAPIGTLAAMVPGLAAGAAGVAALSVIRGARSGLLLAGTVPEPGAGSIFIGIILALIPFLAAANLPGLLGAVLAILISLLFGGAALMLAVRSYRPIPA